MSVGEIYAAEPPDRGFDDIRSLGNGLALFVGGLSV